MTKWKMRADDFYYLLHEVQDYKCYYTGWDLTPECTSIAHKVQIREGGKHEKDNVILVHSFIAKLAREHSEEDVVRICGATSKVRGKDHGYQVKVKK